MEFKGIREDFTSDVYNTLDFLPTNNEANRIIDSFDRVIDDAIVIPKGATNGDMVKAIFNPCRIFKYTSEVQVYFSKKYYQFFGMSWWNAPYKRGNKND